MKSFIFLFSSTLLLFITGANADENFVDFSKAYVIPGTESPNELQIGGVMTYDDDVVLMNSILLGFSAEDRSFKILKAQVQHSDAELLEQRLRGTQWTGTYKTNKNLYLTELTLKTVQNGFIAGEMIHKTADPETSNFLRAEVGGSIITQYFVDPESKNEWVWVNADEVNYETTLPSSHVRQLIRLKRLRGLEFKHASSRWGSQSEYRLVLENNRLTGDVGTPPEDYTTSDGLSGVGLVELEEIVPKPETSPIAPLE
jgi:hypothetical protein